MSKKPLIWIAEITAGIPGSPTERILRVASYPGYNHPTAPGQGYSADILEAANIQRNLVGPRKTFGASTVGAGYIRVNNVDGKYDEWFDYGYGFEAIVYLGYPDTAYNDLIVVMKGNIDQVTATETDMSFNYRDRQIELQQPASPATYLGTNSGTTETEGTNNDIGGQNKIRVFGSPFNITPDPLNVSDRLYGVQHDINGSMSAIHSLTQRLNGANWTNGGDQVSLAALLASAPTQGIYKTYLANGVELLGGSAPGSGGSITCDIVTAATAAGNQMSAVIKQLLNDAGVANSDIDISLDPGSPSTGAWEVGLVVKDENFSDALDALCGQSAVWYCPNRLGVYQVRKFTPPGVPIAGFKKFNYPNVAGPNDYKIESLSRITSTDESRGLPAYQITVNYRKNWTVQDMDALAASISLTDQENYSREFLSLTADNSGIKDQFPQAVSLSFDTLITRQDHAEQLLDDLVALYGVQRSMYNLTAKYDMTLAAAIDLGDTVTVTYNRYGLDNGKNFIITGINYNAADYEITLELWG